MKNTVWLLINDDQTKPANTPFSAKYRIFNDPELAYVAAKEAGLYENTLLGSFPHPREMKVGMAQILKQFPIDAMLIRLELN